MRLANAGHLAPLLVPAQGKPRFAEIETGTPLGTPGFVPGLTDMPLPRGVTLLAFTDGLVEDRHSSLSDQLAELQGRDLPDDPEELCDAVLAASGRATGHDDDIAMLALRLR